MSSSRVDEQGQERLVALRDKRGAQGYGTTSLQGC